MGKVHKRLLFLILIIITISFCVVYFTVDLNTLYHLNTFKPWSIILAIFFVGLGLFLDGTRLMHLVHISKEHISLKEAVKVVFGNYFLALLTPGATGGAVAQVMFLRNAGVPMGKAAVIVIVRTLVSILFLFLCLPIIFLHDSANVFPGISNGKLLVISLTIFMLLILFTGAINFHILDRLAKIIAYRFKGVRRRRFVLLYRETQMAMRMLRAAPRSMVRIFFESGLSLMAIYAVVPCLILGLGVSPDWYTVMGRMIFLNLLLYFMPTPGGSGFAEGGFVLLFSSIVPVGTVGILAVGWRFISEYIPFAIGFYYTVTVFGSNFLHMGESKI